MADVVDEPIPYGKANVTTEDRQLLAESDAVLRVIVADDHEMTRRTLSRVLASDDRIEVVGEAENGEEAVRLTDELAPDVVLLDIRMPVVDGIEALKRIRAAGDTPVVLCSSYRDRQYCEAAARLGAAAFVPKSSDEATIIGAVIDAARISS